MGQILADGHVGARADPGRRDQEWSVVAAVKLTGIEYRGYGATNDLHGWDVIAAFFLRWHAASAWDTRDTSDERYELLWLVSRVIRRRA